MDLSIVLAPVEPWQRDRALKHVVVARIGTSRHQHVSASDVEVRYIGFARKRLLFAALVGFCLRLQQIRARLEREFFQLLFRRQICSDSEVALYVDRCCWIVSEQSVYAHTRYFGITLEADDVFFKARHCELRLQHILLRNLAYRVLDARRFNGLASDVYMLIVDAHLFLRQQEIEECFAHFNPHSETHGLKLLFDLLLAQEEMR